MQRPPPNRAVALPRDVRKDARDVPESAIVTAEDRVGVSGPAAVTRPRIASRLAGVAATISGGLGAYPGPVASIASAGAASQAGEGPGADLRVSVTRGTSGAVSVAVAASTAGFNRKSGAARARRAVTSSAGAASLPAFGAEASRPSRGATTSKRPGVSVVASTRAG